MYIYIYVLTIFVEKNFIKFYEIRYQSNENFVAAA